MNNEPAITVGVISTLIAAAIALLVSFGVTITEEQTKAILAFVAAVFPLLTALVIRRSVTPAVKE